MYILKYYYWVINFVDSSGIIFKGLGKYSIFIMLYCIMIVLYIEYYYGEQTCVVMKLLLNYCFFYIVYYYIEKFLW